MPRSKQALNLAEHIRMTQDLVNLAERQKNLIDELIESREKLERKYKRLQKRAWNLIITLMR